MNRNPLRARRALALLALVSTTVALGACASDDGRTLPPARSDQFESILTTTTADPAATSTLPTLGEDPADVPVDSVASTSVPTTAAPSTLTTIPAPTFTLTLPWTPDGPIPARHACTGAPERDIPPAIDWANVPPEAIELAVVMTDTTAGGYVQWILTGIPATATGLTEGVSPPEAVAAVNSAGVSGYSGPCPPAGETHSYLVEVMALDQQVEVAAVPPADMVATLRAASIFTTAQAGVFPGA